MSNALPRPSRSFLVRTGMEQHFYEKSLDTLNQDRKVMKLKPVELRTRNCLRCGNEFKSIGPQNRLCGCSQVTVYEP